jgi:uncharacterized Zn finger protein
MKIELTCPGCGGNRFALGKANADDSMVACEDCGREVGSLGTLKENVVRQIADRDRPRH